MEKKNPEFNQLNSDEKLTLCHILLVGRDIYIYVYIYIYIYISLRTLVNEFSAAARILQSSSKKLSTLVADRV